MTYIDWGHAADYDLSIIYNKYLNDDNDGGGRSVIKRAYNVNNSEGKLYCIHIQGACINITIFTRVFAHSTNP